MHPVHPPNPKIVATVTAIPWVVIWIAALIVLTRHGASDIPFEHLLAAILVIGSPFAAWRQFKGFWT